MVTLLSILQNRFRPTSSSWLNAVEGWLAQLERRALYRGIFTSIADLKNEIRGFIKIHNKELAKPFKWTKSAENIIASVARAKKVLPN
jgi:transposase